MPKVELPKFKGLSFASMQIKLAELREMYPGAFWAYGGGAHGTYEVFALSWEEIGPVIVGGLPGMAFGDGDIPDVVDPPEEFLEPKER